MDGTYYYGWNKATGAYYTKEEFDGLTEDEKKACAIAYQTTETTNRYADAGFNVLFINWGSTAYSPSSGFEGSLVKQIMDDAWARGIKCFVYGPLYTLSSSQTSLIVGEGKGNGTTTFDTQEDLNAYAAKQLKGIKDHPAFYGVSLVDEPFFTQFDAMGEVYQAVNSVLPGAFCNMNLNPMSYDIRAMIRYDQASKDRWHNATYFKTDDNGKLTTTVKDGVATSVGSTIENGKTLMETAYQNYIELYYEKVGKYCGYIQYDSYPMIYYGTNNTFLYPHIRNAQVVAEYCEETGMRFGHVYQTYRDNGQTNGTDWGHRKMDMDDIEWQVNFGLAMGVKDHSYYTYYPVLNSSSTTPPDEDYTIVDRNGNPNAMYYWVQKLNSDMAVFAKAMAHFEYRGMKYYTKGTVDTSMQAALDIVDKTHKFYNKMEGVSLAANGLAIVSELYDEEAGRYGYFVMNATNPYGTVATQKVTLSFTGYNNVQIYQDGKIRNVALVNGQVTLTLEEAAGAFVIPY